MGWHRIVLAGLVVAVGLSAGAQEKRRPAVGRLKVGQPAPEFALTDAAGKATVKLADLKGKPVVLIFGSCT